MSGCMAGTDKALLLHRMFTEVEFLFPLNGPQ